MEKTFQIFGSQSSEDYDVMIFVDKIPTVVEDAKKLCHKYNEILYMKFVDAGMKIKKLNSNIAVVKDGIIVDIHKGTCDECTNSLFLTYDFHQQFYPNHITRMVERDIDMKIMRSARSILMILSRSKHRAEVKLALRSNFIQKLKALENIDYSTLTEEDIKDSVEFKDGLKQICFQITQSIGLMEGVELYTKEDISNRYPSLSDMLYRVSIDMNEIERCKKEFVRMCKLRLKDMKTFDEYKK